jgi:hypothetical protein
MPGPFLGKDSVNTFPLLGSRFLIMKQLDYSDQRAAFSMWTVPKCCRQGTVLELSQFSVDSQLEGSL